MDYKQFKEQFTEDLKRKSDVLIKKMDAMKSKSLLKL